MKFCILYTVLLLASFCDALLDVYEISFLSNATSKFGLVSPHTTVITEGYELLMKFNSITDTQECNVTTPTGENFRINHPPSTRYEKWTECGLRVKNVTKTDEGRWRFKALNSSAYEFNGFSEVYVNEDVLLYSMPKVHLTNGAHETVDLAVVPNVYCLVSQPYSESSLIPGVCEVDLEPATKAIQGDWSVSLGLAGRVAELKLQREVVVDNESLDVGFVHDTDNNKVHLHCNIINSHMNVSFCRFHKVASPHEGYNLQNGLSDGTHSYYGDGFVFKQCGMTLENPTRDDYTSWRCSVGVEILVNNIPVQQTPLQALINVVWSGASRINTLLKSPTTIREIFIQRDREMTLSCQSPGALAYCWFQGPDGEQYTPTDKVDDGQEYWYSGNGLQLGECGIVFKNAVDIYTGTWTCHMAQSLEIGIENTEVFDVKVTGALAANRNQLQVEVGRNLTLHCHTSSGQRPLHYCRFRTPNYVGINLDASVTEDKSILGRYYFTPGADLAGGDCSLTISSVHKEDFGQWTCAALLLDETSESRATIEVTSENVIFDKPFRAGIAIGVPIAIIALSMVLGITVFFKYQKKSTPAEPYTRTSFSSTTQDAISMSNMDTNSISSFNSNDSSQAIRP